ncbi:hypothetical protein ABB55_11905 [Prosthecomicrobium hirschii]|uniref:Uncharacterized protein n=1 Tax=Prosthecodimorpha hirschii TaxID=665126 RepID=A0A0P6W149_9HYPH|nr:hypothetical protein ABB55_11905 [Prosthecomicrobium hirschii]
MGQDADRFGIRLGLLSLLANDAGQAQAGIVERHRSRAARRLPLQDVEMGVGQPEAIDREGPRARPEGRQAGESAGPHDVQMTLVEGVPGRDENGPGAVAQEAGERDLTGGDLGFDRLRVASGTEFAFAAAQGLVIDVPPAVLAEVNEVRIGL